ncbi:hypothetical protein TSTA_071300 [Talaromyces stipitatus ATCC 10500]|uniref:Uncharacterized protein n=1 Tax=Talaromyces stipitatus (strain ATCC 10500 / CBS 375.48 / QM 6759 / NRRL 1006) TaxID=441959 RepID=B8LUF8_TALSN|nr:uncharacterized protein TSTA_071300 [Talaromyces stipitatus ATCC 10500]EED23731.1 hypothetical protein TSTA_071300 [Talaromyces stipitatus ATCC 10500]
MRAKINLNAGHSFQRSNKPRIIGSSRHRVYNFLIKDFRQQLRSSSDNADDAVRAIASYRMLFLLARGLFCGSKARSHAISVIWAHGVLWLSKSSYTDITVFDMQPVAEHFYNPTEGMDNYAPQLGTEIDYQRLAFEAGLKPSDKLWYSSDMLMMSAVEQYGEFEPKALENMEKEGLRGMQFKYDHPEGMYFVHAVSNTSQNIQRAEVHGWGRKIDPLGKKRLGYNTSVLEPAAGFVGGL